MTPNELRAFMLAFEAAMTEEGVTEEARRRVRNRLLFGVPEGPSCGLCGQPFHGHDDAACEAKMAAWKPLGLFGIREVP